MSAPSLSQHATLWEINKVNKSQIITSVSSWELSYNFKNKNEFHENLEFGDKTERL